MRWTYLLPRAILIGLVWAFFHYGFDPVMRRGMIYTGQRVAHAKVEIAALDTTFFAPTIKAASVHVADRKHPGTNLVEFTDLHAKLELQPLLKKSYIVEEASVSGLQWGTKRDDSGLLPDEEPDLSEDSSNKTLENIKHELLSRGKDWLAGLADRVKLDFDPNQFESVRLGQELEEHWPKEFGQYEDELKALKQRIDELRKSVKVKGGNELEKIERYEQAAKQAQQLLHELEQVKQQLAKTMQQAQEDLGALNEAKSHDVAKIKEKADLLHLDPNEVTELLLGPELTNRLETAIGWAKFIRERIKLATDAPKPERFRGETILFARKQELPLLLIRLLNVDGEGDFSGDHLTFKGSISGITSNPQIHGKPIIVRIDAVGQPSQADPNAQPASTDSGVQLASGQAGKPDLQNAGLNVQLAAKLDYTKDVPIHQLRLSYTEPRPDERDIGKPESIQLAMLSRASNCVAKLKLIGDDLSGQIDYKQALEGITAKLGTKRFKGDERVLSVIQGVVSGIHKIDAQMKLSGTALKPEFTLRSNLGHDLSSGINREFKRELDNGRRDLLARFEQEATKRSEKLTQLYDEQIQKLTGQLNLNKGEVQQIAQSFGIKLPGKLDMKGLGNALPKPDLKLPKFGLQAEDEPAPAIRQASDVEHTLEDLGGLFGKKKKPAPKPTPKTVQPAAGQQLNNK